MKINITAVRMDLTPAIAEYLEKKISSLDKIVDPSDTSVLAHIEVGKETRHHQSGDDLFFAKCQIHLAGQDIFAEAKSETLYAAIDLLRDDLTREMTSQKDKRMTLNKKGGRTLKEMLHRMWPFG